MCISNHVIELQAYQLSEEIRKKTIYKMKRVEVTDGYSLEVEKQGDYWNGTDLISKVVLEDSNGTLYSINPDDTGLRFAKGEITYKEYIQLEKSANMKGIIYLVALIGLSFIVMFILINFLK